MSSESPESVDDSTKVQATAEWDPLQAVRMHLPGAETFVGIMDPEPNLFLNDFSLVDAQQEHLSLSQDLEAALPASNPIHYLHDDLANGNGMNALLSSRVNFDLSELGADEQVNRRDKMWARLHELSPHTQIQAVLGNAEVIRHHSHSDEEVPGSNPDRWDTTSVQLEQPLTNMYFQRDQQFVTQNGVVLCSMKEDTRKPEVDIARASWEALDGDEFDVDIVADMSQVREHDVTEHVPERDDIQETEVLVEGGDFYPAGEFSLLGVSAKIPEGEAYPKHDIAADDTEYVHRSTYAAGHRLLMDDAFGSEEVGLVRAPFEAAQAHKDDDNGEVEMDIMHLDTWFNFVDDDLVVAHKELVENTTLDVYARTHGGEKPYTLERPDVNFGEYLREKGFEIVDVYDYVDPSHPDTDMALKAITNFLTVGPRKILPVRFSDDDDGVMKQFIDGLQEDYDVTVIPDGEGRKIINLRAGYGAIHCMTTPLRRTPE
ncbi:MULTISPECIES: arginine deiminase family protein [Halobacterium]|uniref:arginine deiminase n=1 Tax=Halobacterium TaxID=2239 RepID=UPI0019665625|nr:MULTISPECIES: arginine deiminase family protein [Halobacterium]MCF2164974.1 arginine deiminase [Halobacterium salinarum]MCF2168447.1 arginine deiminase [Halobacterium salinarum]MCF2237659.1 arginine deiminase [Halobacterium salinarum]QRY21477.1 arginine deiminase [Halobacterium sp. GSL-19]WJK64852.1 arginine deiminase [Halobacterium salinarum]